jgi:CRP/FNR family transcriptional regulator, cyclic AMP receptor protein
LNQIDMRTFAKNACPNIKFGAGAEVFRQGDPANCMYIVQSGVVEMIIGDKVVDSCGPNQAFGFMAVIDEEPRTSTARVKEEAEVSIIDQRRFRFMVDEIPNFALYVMQVMAHRIRGMSHAI